MSPFDHVPRLSSLPTRLAEPEPLPPGWARRATALGPLPCRPRRSASAAAPLLVIVDGHCLPQEGECLCSTTYLDCRRCPSAGLSRSRCPRAGPAGPLRWGRCPAALAVPPPLPLHCWWSPRALVPRPPVPVTPSPQETASPQPSPYFPVPVTSLARHVREGPRLASPRPAPPRSTRPAQPSPARQTSSRLSRQPEPARRPPCQPASP